MTYTNAMWLAYAGLAEARIAELEQALNEAVTTLGVVGVAIDPENPAIVDYRGLVAYMKPAIENGRKVLNEEN